MRFKNLSRKNIPKELWYSLAAGMNLNSVLPGSINDSYMYGPYNKLSVRINPERNKPQGEIVECGAYTYGKIYLYPCCNCTIRFLTQVFLHELHHAWVHQYHPDIHSKEKDSKQAEFFADAGFKVLGGKIRPKNVCGSYELNIQDALKRIDKFLEFSKSLTRRNSKDVLKWSHRNKSAFA